MEANAFEPNSINAAKDLILDEHKLVTYVSLSKELCIHVNHAKLLLSRIIQDIRKNKPEIALSVSFLISGLLKNNSGCTTVCSETDRENIKKSLKILFYEHVYCVSRGVESIDNAALTAINKFEDLSLCTGLIKSNACSKRTDDEIGNLKAKNQAVVIDPKSTSAQQKNSKDKVKEVIKYENGNAKKSNEVKSESNLKSKTPSPKKDIPTKTSAITNGKKTAVKGIAGFFSKANGESKSKRVNVEEPEVKVEKEIKVEPMSSYDISSKSMNNAKEKACNKNSVSKANGESKSKKAKDQEPEVKIEKEIKFETMSSDDISSKSVNNAKGKASNKNSLNQIKKNAKVDKKRKRLLHVSDSESETETNDPFTNEMDVDHESEDEIPPTPTVNTVKITSGIVNPKKRRKVVDKTYTDEDGYILTKKEEVYESCSENEEEFKENGIYIKDNTKQTKDNTEQVKQIKTETSPKESKGKKKKVSPPQKGKQSTINSFFKKL